MPAAPGVEGGLMAMQIGTTREEATMRTMAASIQAGYDGFPSMRTVASQFWDVNLGAVLYSYVGWRY